jgi:hypothetical protein
VALGLSDFVASVVDWHLMPDRPYHFAVTVASNECVLRLNDFPDENIATIWVEDMRHELDEFPVGWRLPQHRGE